MTLGQRMLRALERADLTQIELSRRSGVDKYTIGDIVNDRRDPQISTLAKLLSHVPTTWAEFFDEPRIALSSEEVIHLREARDTLDRLLANDAAQKKISHVPAPQADASRRSRRRGKTGGAPPPTTTKPAISDRGRRERDEVQPSLEPIPEWHYREGARRAFTVTTDSMIGAEGGILEGATIFVRMSVDVEAADGKIVICVLNGTRYLKQLDLRGRQTVLVNLNPRYPKLTVTEKDDFALFGVVEMEPAE